MDDSIVIERILTRIDKFDDKLDTNIGELQKDMTNCKIGIQSVKSDLKNHLDNKKSETESLKRRFYIGSALFGAIFTAYTVVQELF